MSVPSRETEACCVTPKTIMSERLKALIRNALSIEAVLGNCLTNVTGLSKNQLDYTEPQFQLQAIELLEEIIFNIANLTEDLNQELR